MNPKLFTSWLCLFTHFALAACSTAPEAPADLENSDPDDAKDDRSQGEQDPEPGDAGSAHADDAKPSPGADTLQGDPDPYPFEEPRCGTGQLDAAERCDDGNTEDGDGCSKDCSTISDGFVCEPGQLCVQADVCGDRRQTGAEQCDDWNTKAGDGCSSSCQVETGFACPTPGLPCVSNVQCGDGRLSALETCDDRNQEANDGCSEVCQVEPGWVCSQPGQRCTTHCGDGVLTGAEDCDDGNATAQDGCSERCELEQGYVCLTAGERCQETVCGDGKVEGHEACDEGPDLIVGDGCSPGCKLEPDCSQGPCSSRCGDGLILPGDNEQCDDGNAADGDGCSQTCQQEAGYLCTRSTSDTSTQVELPVLYRDFIAFPADGAERHPDFQYFFGVEETLGLVGPELTAEGKPEYTGLCEEGANFSAVDCPHDAMTTSQANFRQWYENTDGVNQPILQTLAFEPQANGTYVFEVASGMFPLDDLGWVAEGSEETADGHNYGFTTELRSWFEFQGGEFLEFSGDDDVWVFIAGQLAVDIGGLHPSRTVSVTLDETKAAELGLELGHVYEIALFHAERRTEESNFKLTLKGFNAESSACAPECGDGIIAGDEQCDDGLDNGMGYGFCTADCTPGPRCGDGQVDEAGNEACDNGENLDGYAQISGGCAPGCVAAPYCGDGNLDATFAETCDLGTEKNDGSYGGCTEDCKLAPRCGDGVVNGEEECDDGNISSNDTCDVECQDVQVPISR